ncbi:MAG: cation-transporting P-type ATPase [archaeon]|nr:cation-transporting P-type ATPase [archaeon]
MEWHTLSPEDSIARQDSSIEGISMEEVQTRTKRYGFNKLAEPEKTPAFLRFISQYNDPLNYLLIGAALVALAIHPDQPGDAIFIFIVLTANAFFGFWQEGQAEQAMDSLKQMSVSTCVVIRGTFESEIPTPELVPGDIVCLEQGLNVPADVRMIRSLQCKIDESALTGESLTVRKTVDALPAGTVLAERTNMAYMGTTVSSGRGLGLVIGTGMNTELGKIAQNLAESTTPKTPLELKLESLGRFLGFIALVVAVLLVSLNLIVSYGRPGVDLKEVAVQQFIVAIAIFVAIVPEGLPIILVITLSLGMRNMARHKAIIRRMKAVETLGSTTVICSDKTGTLTKNQMTVRQIFTLDEDFGVSGEGFKPDGNLVRHGIELSDDDLQAHQSDMGFRLLSACLSLCHNSTIAKTDGLWQAIGDPTDSACAVAGWKINGDVKKFAHRHPRINEFFFDSTRKRMSVLHEYQGSRWVFSKGSVEGYADLMTSKIVHNEVVPLTKDDHTSIRDMNETMGGKAMRVIGLFARPFGEDEDMNDVKTIESNLVFLGLIGIMDPPRPEVKDAIATCQRAGIKVKMITGDQQMTAAAIGRELDIKSGTLGTLDGQSLSEMSDEELINVSANVSIYARVTPDQKMRIVSSLQAQGEIVAMTGDGVNDAPALSGANIGVAMGISGTDVAKDAADMVLQDDNFANIVHAVEEGRKIYQNIRNFVRYQVSTNVAAVLLLVLATVLFGPESIPLTATQILVINILMDGPPAVALGVEKKHGNVMNQPPRPVDEGLPNGKDISLIFYLGIVMVTGTLAIFYLAGGGLAECEMLPTETTTTAFDVVACNAGDVEELNKWQVYADGHFAHAQTMTFSVFIVFQLFNVLNCRSNDQSVFELGLFSNRAINLALLISGGLLLFFVQLADASIPLVGIQVGNLLSTTTLSANDWTVVVLVASGVFIIEEFRKLLVKSKFFSVRAP